MKELNDVRKYLEKALGACPNRPAYSAKADKIIALVEDTELSNAEIIELCQILQKKIKKGN